MCECELANVCAVCVRLPVLLFFFAPQTGDLDRDKRYENSQIAFELLLTVQ